MTFSNHIERHTVKAKGICKSIAKKIGFLIMIFAIGLVFKAISAASPDYALRHVEGGPTFTCLEDAEAASGAFVIYNYHLENNSKATAILAEQEVDVQRNIEFHLAHLSATTTRSEFLSETADSIDAREAVFYKKFLADCRL
ncbi:hypothetical protein [Falsihalocynthiibacter arcticus]|uniref:Uncharacterized protein n=1 Tax=Falsihalocynthiibacter arcticus TaxID=1579316 RepID=A0A126V553_9RHOB|nr:hypothetical protein [Falsihalocynthiibacter arcticus]AML52829.1 hypothetical protein RC74_17590 [Falsihalocynthiibacter arcticus]